MEMKMEKDVLELGEVKKHFFKVLIGDFKTCLRIPPQFVKNLLDEKEGAINRSKSVRATIEGPSGRIWNLKIEKKRDGLFFTTGWPKFVEDHVLHKCEFLVFRYNDNFHFSIMIFAVSGCEKEERVRETPVTREKGEKLSQRREMETTIEERESQERGSDVLVTPQAKLKPNKDCEIAVDSDEKNEETNKLDNDCEIIANRGEGKKQVKKEDQLKEMNFEEITKFVRECRNLATKKRAKDFNLESLLSAKRNKSAIAHTSFKLKKEIKDPSGNSSPDSNKDGSNNEEDEVEEITKSDMPSLAKICWTHLYELAKCKDDVKALRAATSFQSKFPSLVIHITNYMAKQSGQMRIHDEFSKMYMPRERTVFDLRILSGVEWSVEYVPRARALSRGWSAFKHGNSLQEDDCCVFELVKPTKFRVHIFRASG